jgi:hypothetical protein
MRAKITGDYMLQFPKLISQITNEEIFLECDTTNAPVNIILPPIEDAGGFLNAVINIYDAAGNSNKNPITIKSDYTDEMIGGNTVKTISKNHSSAIIRIVGKKDWSFQTPETSDAGSEPVLLKRVTGEEIVAARSGNYSEFLINKKLGKYIRHYFVKCVEETNIPIQNCSVWSWYSGSDSADSPFNENTSYLMKNYIGMVNREIEHSWNFYITASNPINPTGIFELYCIYYETK